MVLYLSKIKKKEPLSTAQRMKQNEIEKPKKERALQIYLSKQRERMKQAIERKRRKSKTAGKSRR